MSDFLTNINNKYGVSNKAGGAWSFLRENISMSEAVVGIFESNGIAGFKFHIPEAEQVKFESDVTDNYTALNTSYQDHIALRPITITLSGMQGEYFYDLHPIENAVSTIASSLTLISAFLPTLSNITKQIKNKTSFATYNFSDEEYNYDFDNSNSYNAIELWAIFQQIFKLKSAQTRAFLYFERLWSSRARFTVETSWKRYDNMVIQSLTPIRDSNADITNFNITFKQLQFADSYAIDIKSIGRTKIQKSQKEIKATAKGKNVNTLMSYTQGISEFA